MNTQFTYFALFPALLLLSACQAENDQSNRWYTQTMVDAGQPLYQQYCAECHQADASGAKNWREPTADGKLPPPPLNGTAHAWHHPLPGLMQTIRNGGIVIGGTMPPFKDKLSDEQITNVLAWVQTHWPDELYRAWEKRNQQ